MDAPAAVILGTPSADLATTLDTDESTRIAAQVGSMGPEGIYKATMALKLAKEEHDKPIPVDIIKEFPVPDAHSISWISVQSVQDGPSLKSDVSVDSLPLQKCLNNDTSPAPFFSSQQIQNMPPAGNGD